MVEPALVQGVTAVVVVTGAALAGRFALRKGAARERIDPFTLTDPWRSFVQDAQSAQTRFSRIVSNVAPGPLHERLADVERRVSDGVRSAWRIAQNGHTLHKMILQVGGGSDSVTRMRGREKEFSEKLAALIRNLNEAVARAAELATGQLGAVDAVAEDVNGVVDDLEALRLSFEEVEGPGELPRS
jgi:hypothetical protein